MLNKCGLCRFRCFIQLIKVTVSFESLFLFGLFFVFLFCFCFFPCLSLFYFQLSGVIGVSSVKTLFIFFPFSYLSYFFNPPVRSTRSLSNKILFHGCVTMESHCSPGFSPPSLVILTWLRTELKAFLVMTFQQTSLCLLSRTLLSL